MTKETAERNPTLGVLTDPLSPGERETVMQITSRLLQDGIELGDVTAALIAAVLVEHTRLSDAEDAD